MLSQRQRAVVVAGVALVVIWALALAGYTVARNAKITTNKVRAYVESVDLGRLSTAGRGQAVQKLVRMLNALPLEERQAMRLDRTAYRWFGQMSEAERRALVEATMPPGFKQMLSAFEQLPEDRQLRMIDQTLRQLRAMGGGGQSGTNGLPRLDPELLMQIRAEGLDSFYNQSSPEMQAQLAPVLEELQHVMETGSRFRGRDAYGEGRNTNIPPVKGSK